jgi:hypothetical protein
MCRPAMTSPQQPCVAYASSSRPFDQRKPQRPEPLAESNFEAAEGKLGEVNEAFNDLAAELREKQQEIAEAQKACKRLEDELVKR